MLYDSVHKFDKYRSSNFYEIPSTDSKFATINKFYKDLLKLNNVKSKTEYKKQKKANVLKDTTKLFYEWISVYKKNMSSFLKVKMKTGGKNMIMEI